MRDLYDWSFKLLILYHMLAMSRITTMRHVFLIIEERLST